MKKIFLSITLLVAGVAQAQSTYTPAPVMSAALSRSIAVELAQAELDQSKTALTRLNGDPLALKADLLTAQSRVLQAQAGLLAAQLALRVTVSQELAALGAAENDLGVARGKLELAKIAHKGVEIKLSAGTANRVELEKAQSDVKNAQNEVAQAEDNLADARAKVTTRLGSLPKAPLGKAPTPVLNTLQAALAQHPRQLKADAAVVTAKRDYAVKNSDLSAASEIKTAQNALDAALKTAEDTSRSLRSELGDAWQRYQTALSTLANRERSANTAAENARMGQTRFEKGLVSKQAALQAKNDAAAAAAALSAARAALETALANLAVAANVDVWR